MIDETTPTTTLIRFATAQDMGEIARIYAPYTSTPITFDECPLTTQEFLERYEQTCRFFPWLVLEHQDHASSRLLGYAYAHPQHERKAYQWNAETSIYLDQDTQGHGYGGVLYDTLLELLQMLGFKMAYALVTLPNPASENLHHSRGFSTMGIQQHAGYTCGSWRDVAWLVKQLSAFDSHPAPPIALETFMANNPETIRQLLKKSAARIS
ncbi:GNAT family N-acetyltransferase [Adlercreutzia agrestimuris]|uniref:GNAT family N-acetyltransferase n=1 Tax=Adlercreutzia agrestimuris TaxID=2941324 RepID=UPI00203A8750|nr:GNAT family N-acetyltransferase [Adlercreutzia agrestimuris]